MMKVLSGLQDALVLARNPLTHTKLRATVAQTATPHQVQEVSITAGSSSRTTDPGLLTQHQRMLLILVTVTNLVHFIYITIIQCRNKLSNGRK